MVNIIKNKISNGRPSDDGVMRQIYSDALRKQHAWIFKQNLHEQRLNRR